MNIGFSQTVYSMMEDDENGRALSVEVCLVLTGSLNRSVTVSLSTSDGTAIGVLHYVVQYHVRNNIIILGGQRDQPHALPVQFCANYTLFRPGTHQTCWVIW